MRSRIYTSRFYPQEMVSLSSDCHHDLFTDLERASFDRVERDRIKSEQKNSDNIFVIEIHDDIGNNTNEIKRVIITGVPDNNDSSVQLCRLSKKKNRTRFRLFYENGDYRDVEATNGGSLYRFLIRQCRICKK